MVAPHDTGEASGCFTESYAILCGSLEIRHAQVRHVM